MINPFSIYDIKLYDNKCIVAQLNKNPPTEFSHCSIELNNSSSLLGNSTSLKLIESELVIVILKSWEFMKVL